MEATNVSPRKSPQRLSSYLFCAVLLLAGCAAPASDPARSTSAALQPATASAATDRVDAPEPTQTGAPVAQAPTATRLPTEPPAPTESNAPDSACLECHVDKERLIDTADPEMEVVSENKGEG